MRLSYLVHRYAGTLGKIKSATMIVICYFPFLLHLGLVLPCPTQIPPESLIYVGPYSGWKNQPQNFTSLTNEIYNGVQQVTFSNQTFISPRSLAIPMVIMSQPASDTFIKFSSLSSSLTLETGQDFVLKEDGDSGHCLPKSNAVCELEHFFNCASSPDSSLIESRWQSPKEHVRK